MNDIETISGVISVVFGLAIIALHVIVLTYITKLENIHCPCADHPFRNYLKYYMMVAIVLLTINMFVPFLQPGAMVSGFMGFFLFLWVGATIAFYIMAVKYVRYLVKAKCECSEDVRRQVLYVWSILELCLLAVLFLLPLFIFVVMGAISLLVSSASMGVKALPGRILEQSVTPLKSLRKVPGSLRDSIKKVSNRVKQISRR
jgi:hypothetical protein